MDTSFFVRLPYFAIHGLLSVFPYVFLGCGFWGCSTLATPCYRCTLFIYGFLPTVFSVPYLLSGPKQSQRCFELNKCLVVDPSFWLAALLLYNLATFPGIVPVIS